MTAMTVCLAQGESRRRSAAVPILLFAKVMRIRGRLSYRPHSLNPYTNRLLYRYCCYTLSVW